jgi:hypothetical protein
LGHDALRAERHKLWDTVLVLWSYGLDVNMGYCLCSIWVTDSMLLWDTCPCSLRYVSLYYWDTGPCSIGIRVPVLLGYESLFFGIRVLVRLAYAYIYHGVFVCAVFMIYIFLVAWFKCIELRVHGWLHYLDVEILASM